MVRQKSSQDRLAVEAFREQMGWSMTVLAEKAGFHVSNYSRWLSDESELSDLNIRRLSRLSGVAVSTFHRYREERRRVREGSV